MPDSLTAEERRLRAQVAAHARHATSDGTEATAAARAASPGSDEYWLGVVDPDGVLSGRERAKRARNAKSEHFARLAYESHKAQRANKAPSK